MSTDKRKRARRKVPPVVLPTVCLRRALKAAERYARKMGHAYVGTDHLIITLLASSATGFTSRALAAECGIDPDRMAAIMRQRFEAAFTRGQNATDQARGSRAGGNA